MSEINLNGLQPGLKVAAPEPPAPPAPPAPADNNNADDPFKDTPPPPPDPAKQTDKKDDNQDNNPPVPDHAKFLTEIFGEGHPYDSIEKVKAIGISERLRELQALKEEQVRAKADLEKYKAKVAMVESPKFLESSQYAHFADELKKEGLDVDYPTFKKLSTFDPTKLTDVQKIVLWDAVKHGENGRSADEINKHYKLGDFAEEDGEGNKVESETDKKALRREAAEAQQKLLAKKEIIGSYKPEFQDDSAAREANLKQWENSSSEAVKHITTIQLPSYENTAFGIKVETAYQVTEDDQKVIAKMWDAEVNKRALPLTKENAEIIYGSVLKEFSQFKEREKFKLYGDKLIGAVDMRLKTLYSNFRGLDYTPERKAPDSTVKKPGSGQTADDVFKQKMKEQGLKV